MKKTHKLSTLFVATIMTFSVISGTVAVAHEREPALVIEQEQDSSEILEESPGYVYDENGQIIDYWFGNDFEEDERDLYFFSKKCTNHNWELVSKLRRGANGNNIRVYNRRCKNCAKYKYQSWSASKDI